MDQPIDIDHLEALAERASPCHWVPFVGAHNTCEVHRDDGVVIIKWTGFDGAGTPKRQHAHDARFIAAANPQTINYLTGRIRELESNVRGTTEMVLRQLEDWATPNGASAGLNADIAAASMELLKLLKCAGGECPTNQPGR